MAKFKKVLPRTLGQANRIPGVTPADIGILSIHVDRQIKRNSIGNQKESSPPSCC